MKIRSTDISVDSATNGQVLQVSDGAATWGSVSASASSNSIVYIGQQVLGAAASAVTFSDIPTSYEDLIVVYECQVTTTNATTELRLQFNNDSNANYDWRSQITTTPTSSMASTYIKVAEVPPAKTSGTTDGQLAGELEILNYSSGSFAKTCKSHSTARYVVSGGFGADIASWWNSGFWNNAAAAVNSIKLFPSANSFTAGSKFTLYARAKSNGVGSNDPTLFLIHDQILATAAATYDVTNIPQTYDDLVVLVEARQNTGTNVDFSIRPNNDSGANYSSYVENRFGSVTYSDRVRFGCSEAATATAGIYAPSEGTIFGYSSTTRFKTILSKGYYPSQGFEDRNSSVWKSTAPISSLRVYPSANSFDAGTRIRVYGRKPSLAPTSSGSTGNVSTTTRTTILGNVPIRPNGYTSFSAGYFGCQPIITEDDCYITDVQLFAAIANPTVTLTPGVYTVGSSGQIDVLVAQGPTVTGATFGINKLPLSTPLFLPKGSMVWVGTQVATSALNIAANPSNTGAYFTSTGALTNPASGSFSYGAGFAYWAGITTTVTNGSNNSTPFAPWTIPSVTSFTPYNLGTVTINNSTRGIIFDNPTGNGFASRGFWMPTPSTPWDAYALVDFSMVAGENNYRGGIVVGNSAASDKNQTFGMRGDGNSLRIAVNVRFNTPTSYSGESSYFQYSGQRVWMRLSNDGTNLTHYLGDGYFWQQIQSVTIASFMTAVDRVGIMFQSSNRSLFTVNSFSLTAPAIGGGGPA